MSKCPSVFVTAKYHTYFFFFWVVVVGYSLSLPLDTRNSLKESKRKEKRTRLFIFIYLLLFFIILIIIIIIMGSVSVHSHFETAESVAPDGIFEVLRRFNADSSPDKINVCVGAYRDENGKPWVLPAVRMAEKKIAGSDHEYLPMMGSRGFRDAVVELLFHDSKALAEGRVSIFPFFVSFSFSILLPDRTLCQHDEPRYQESSPFRVPVPSS